MKNVTAPPRSITVHGAQSSHYRYRTPYIPALFESICKELNVTGDSVLMDLGCGRGEVSYLLSHHAGRVHAVDGSPEMIALARRRENIEYQVLDLNSATPRIAGKVDHLFFGRSIHWFPAESLVRLSSELLLEHGRIVVCSTQWSPVGEWGGVYSDVKEKFVPRGRGPRHDFTGRTNLGEAGFVPLKQIASESIMHADTRFMIGHVFSTTYGEKLTALERSSAELELEMTTRLKTYEESKRIQLKISSWAIIFARRGS